MNKLFKILSFLAVLVLFVTACVPQAVQAEPAKADVMATASYQAMLGKSLNDKEVVDFIASNNCSSAEQFQLCRSAGMTLWIDAGQKVKSVFLYPGDDDGFTAYRGQLPFGLTFTDTMEMVEQKLGHPVEIHAPQAGREPGLPDEGVTPDHIHYLAIYKQFGMIIIYNSPSASDKGATIHSILVDK